MRRHAGTPYATAPRTRIHIVLTPPIGRSFHSTMPHSWKPFANACYWWDACPNLYTIFQVMVKGEGLRVVKHNRSGGSQMRIIRYDPDIKALVWNSKRYMKKGR